MADQRKAVRRVDRGELSRPEAQPNGWLRVDGYLSRTGIQAYRMPDGTEHREFRPEAEVFHADAVKSFGLVPLTDEHPAGGLLNSQNTRAHQVGTVGPLEREGERTRAPILVTDAATVDAMRAGKVQLSCGYTCDLDFTPGEHGGQRYDAVQRNIRGNHVALTHVGRAGADIRVRMDDGFNAVADVGTEDAGTPKGDAVEKKIAELEVKLDAAEKATAAALKATEAQRARADAAEADLKKARADSAPEALQKRVAERVALEGKAREILGAKVKLDSLADLEVKRQVAEKVHGVKMDGKAEAYVDASYDLALKRHEDEPGILERVEARADTAELGGAEGRYDGDADQAAYRKAMREASQPKRTN